jgi:DNA-binding MarR family transcriptional regulator
MTPSRPNVDQRLAGAFDGCLGTAARLIDRAIMAIFDERLRPLGLRGTQVTLLATIAGSPGELSAADLVGPMQMDQTTLSRNLARLAEQGLIERTASSDARRVTLALSAAGRKALREAAPLWAQAQAEVTRRLGDRSAESLRAAAARLSQEF